MRLSEAQAQFAAALDAPLSDAAARRFAQCIKTRGGISNLQRLQIYRDGTKAARMNALKAIYPICLAIVGERCFKGLARDFIVETPSRWPDLNRYGEDFARFLQPVSAWPAFTGLEYLPDLARLEWLWHGLYYAGDDPDFDAQAFARDAADDADGIAFQVSASLRLYESPWPVAEVWERHRERRDLQELRIGKGDRLVLWRHVLDCRMQRVDADLFRLMRAVSDGGRLGEMGRAGVAVDRLGEALSQGWIVGHRRSG